MCVLCFILLLECWGFVRAACYGKKIKNEIVILTYTAKKKSPHLDLTEQIGKSLPLDDYCSD